LHLHPKGEEILLDYFRKSWAGLGIYLVFDEGGNGPCPAAKNVAELIASMVKIASLASK